MCFSLGCDTNVQSAWRPQVELSLVFLMKANFAYPGIIVKFCYFQFIMKLGQEKNGDLYNVAMKQVLNEQFSFLNWI